MICTPATTESAALSRDFEGTPQQLEGDFASKVIGKTKPSSPPVVARV